VTQLTVGQALGQPSILGARDVQSILHRNRKLIDEIDAKIRSPFARSIRSYYACSNPGYSVLDGSYRSLVCFVIDALKYVPDGGCSDLAAKLEKFSCGLPTIEGRALLEEALDLLNVHQDEIKVRKKP